MKHLLILALIFLAPIMVSRSSPLEEAIPPGAFRANLKVFKGHPANNEWNHYVTFYDNETVMGLINRLQEEGVLDSAYTHVARGWRGDEREQNRTVESLKNLFQNEIIYIVSTSHE